MKKLFMLLALMLVISGCTFDVANKTVGIRQGQFIFIDGSLKGDYRFSFDKVWAAAEKTLVELKALDIRKEKRIALGTVSGFIGDEKATIMLDYIDREQTMVSVVVGNIPIGNNLASRLIHDKLTEILIRESYQQK
jgi:hypothetical protein